MLNHPAKTRDDFSISPHFRTHLQCHIDSKHPKSFQSKADKFVLVNKTHKGKNTRQFQCTYCKCGAKITRLGQHLHCTHKITDAKVLSQVKASCIHLPNLNKPRTTTEGSLIARPQPKKTKKTQKSTTWVHFRLGRDLWVRWQYNQQTPYMHQKVPQNVNLGQVLRAQTKQLTGNAQKVYLRSMEFFVKFIAKGLMYNEGMPSIHHK